MFQVKGLSNTEWFLIMKGSMIDVLFSGSKESKESYLPMFSLPIAIIN